MSDARRESAPGVPPAHASGAQRARSAWGERPSENMLGSSRRRHGTVAWMSGRRRLSESTAPEAISASCFRGRTPPCTRTRLPDHEIGQQRRRCSSGGIRRGGAWQRPEMYGLSCDSKRAVYGPLRAAKGEKLAKVSDRGPTRRETSHRVVDGPSRVVSPLWYVCHTVGVPSE